MNLEETDQWLSESDLSRNCRGLSPGFEAPEIPRPASSRRPMSPDASDTEDQMMFWVNMLKVFEGDEVKIIEDL
jgi:hypothetical protein